jgi:hypothetical protein
MEGGTTFHFLNASPAEALEAAREAAGGLDVRIGGGPTTIRQFLPADLVDYMHVVIVPIVLGRGERLWDSLEELEQRFHIEAVSSPSGVTASHIRPPIDTLAEEATWNLRQDLSAFLNFWPPCLLRQPHAACQPTWADGHDAVL